jgi:hypothetical protein
LKTAVASPKMKSTVPSTYEFVMYWRWVLASRVSWLPRNRTLR